MKEGGREEGEEEGKRGTMDSKKVMLRRGGGRRGEGENDKEMCWRRAVREVCL